MPGPVLHGTTVNQARRCHPRCPECKAVFLTGTRAARAQRAAQTATSGLPAGVRHGTNGAYDRWQCKCVACLAAHRDYQAAYRRRPRRVVNG